MKRSSKIIVLIADDHEIFLDGLGAMLSLQPDIVVCGSASNGVDLVTKAKALQPDVVLTDILMPLMDGIEATKQILKDFPAIQVIALSMSEQDNMILDMLAAGASGYLIKNAHKSEVLEAIHSVHQHIPYYCRSTSTRLARLIAKTKFNRPDRDGIANAITSAGAASTGASAFSPKEIEIIRLICQDKTSKEISEILHMGQRTVEGHRTKILEKMNVRSSIGVLVYAVQHGLWRIEEK